MISSRSPRAFRLRCAAFGGKLEDVRWRKKNKRGAADKRGDARSSLESALDRLRAFHEAGGTDAGGWIERFPGELAAFREWAEEAGAVLELEPLQAQVCTGGQEHDVIAPPGTARVTKLTKRSSFGRFPGYSSEFGVSSRPALASESEYLERLHLQNELFGDDNRLEGIALSDGGSVYTVTSQPFIDGRGATWEEIRDRMNESDFEVIDDRRGSRRLNQAR